MKNIINESWHENIIPKEDSQMFSEDRLFVPYHAIGVYNISVKVIQPPVDDMLALTRYTRQSG